MPKIILPYGKKPKQRLLFKQPSMTEQSHKNECDINQIMAKYQRTGIIEHGNQNQPQYGDYPSTDYHASLNFVIEAEKMFDSLPSSLRKRFENDPQKYLEFVENPENQKEMQKMGLTKTPYSPPTNQTEIKPTDKEAPPNQTDVNKD